MRSNQRVLRLSFALCAAAMVGGCAAPQSTLLYVFSTHHATPEDGAFPERGLDEQPRIFDNDEGWTVTLVESYVTIERITLVSCGGAATGLNMFWGPCPEDLRVADLQVLTVAGNKVDPDDYCQLVVDYGHYRMPEIDPASTDTRHQVPENEAVDGTTVYLRGGASQNPEDPLVEFELRGTKTQSVALDLSTVDEGGPLRVDPEEAFPIELTISKTYDRFFDGIDFDAYDPDDLEDDLDGILEDETKVQLGKTVMVDAL